MTVAQLIDHLQSLPPDAIVLMEDGAGLSQVSAVDFLAAFKPGAPAEVILLPNMDE